MRKKSNQSFSERVRAVVQQIPPGETRTYSEVAKHCGNPKAARAVARIMSANYDMTVPCHRVVRTDGSLGGYNRGGVRAKERLLAVEARTRMSAL